MSFRLFITYFVFIRELESAVDEQYSVEASLMLNADTFLWKNTNKKCSVFFVNVNNGRNRKIQESCSWYNEEEVNAIMSFLHKCSSSQIPFKEIGIVTPYALQVKKLKHQVSVGTSVSYSFISLLKILINLYFTGNRFKNWHCGRISRTRASHYSLIHRSN